LLLLSLRLLLLRRLLLLAAATANGHTLTHDAEGEGGLKALEKNNTTENEEEGRCEYGWSNGKQPEKRAE